MSRFWTFYTTNTPNRPRRRQVKLYAKPDNRFYTLDPDGTESQIGSGGGSALAESWAVLAAPDGIVIDSPTMVDEFVAFDGVNKIVGSDLALDADPTVVNVLTAGLYAVGAGVYVTSPGGANGSYNVGMIFGSGVFEPPNEKMAYHLAVDIDGDVRPAVGGGAVLGLLHRRVPLQAIWLPANDTIRVDVSGDAVSGAYEIYTTLQITRLA